MKKQLLLAFLTLTFALGAFAQSPFRIQARCQPPNQSTYGAVTVTSVGDVRHVPCPARSSIFTGNVDFSGATVTFGTLSANRFLGGNGTAALPSFSFTSDGDTGFYRVGANSIGVSTGGAVTWNFHGAFLENISGGNVTIQSATGDLNLLGGDNINITSGLDVVLTGGGGGTVRASTSSGRVDLNAFNVDPMFARIDPNIFTVSNDDADTVFTVDGTAKTIALTSGSNMTVTSNAGFNLDSATASFGSTGNMTFRNGSTAGIAIDSVAHEISIGDLTFAGSFLSVDDNLTAQLFGNTETVIGATASSLRVVAASDTLRSTLATWDMSAAGGAGFGVTNYLYSRTITAGGTTGNQTINLPSGTVNFAAGAGVTGITVTNSTVTANSIVFAVARTNDATCSVKNVVPAAGSFVIRMDANCTAETSVGFLVTN